MKENRYHLTPKETRKGIEETFRERKKEHEIKMKEFTKELKKTKARIVKTEKGFAIKSEKENDK